MRIILLKLLNKIYILIKYFEEVSVSICTFILILILAINVVARLTGGSFYFIDEIAMFLVIWITFIGMAHATRNGRHVMMSALLDIFPKKVQKILVVTNCITSSVVMFYMTYISFRYIQYVYFWNHVTTSLRIPYWIVYFIAPIGFSMSGLYYLLAIVKNIQVKEETWMSYEQKIGISEEVI